MQAAHLHAQSCGALVHHSSVEEVVVRKRGPDGTSTNKLRVRPICCTQWVHQALSPYHDYVLEQQVESRFR